jgi:type II secretion system protein N
MAVVATEVQSLNDIQYKSKFKILFLILTVFFLFIFSFLSFYPIGDKIKSIIKTSLHGQGCNPDFDEMHLEWLLPKIVISDLSIPAGCLGKTGGPILFSRFSINYNIINFAPFGLPFRIDTTLGGQAISLYYVLGFNSQMIRLKDQTLDLAKLKPILGENVKLAGNVTIDLNLGMSSNRISNLSLKAQSKNLQIPSQNIQGFTTPPIKLNEFYLEGSSEAHPRVQIDKLIMGDTDSPLRANFKGKIDLQEGNIAMSPLDLSGEIAFSENFKTSVPLVSMIFASFSQKDGFYQIRLGGTLGSPKPSAP